MPPSTQLRELRQLLELYCENRISPQQLARLEELARADDVAMQFYLDYIELHGSLIWDFATPAPASMLAASGPQAAIPQQQQQRPRRRRIRTAAAIVVGCIATAILLLGLQKEPNQDAELADGTGSVPEAPLAPHQLRADRIPGPLQLGPVAQNPQPTPPDTVPTPRPPAAAGRPLDDDQIVAEIDRLIAESWQVAGVEPSKPAARNEWTRRVTLDLLGRIPSVDELSRASGERTRAVRVDRLLADSGFARFWATNWTNLLIGRTSDPGINRPAFEKFLRERFARNVPWNQTVAELIAAEGTTEDNGATNFLVAHLNSQAVPATAVTARVFLGIQVQCTQCHDHPFNSSWKQDQFWTLNSFFKQTERKAIAGKSGAETGYRLTSTRRGGPIHYETRSGLMKAAYPRFAGKSVDAGSDTNRRRELAKIVTEEENSQLARAMVNRVWAHFFGRGFTNPVDDMGPHNPPSHPEVLNLLAEQFRLSGFDLRRLIRWVALSRSYSLESRFSAGNAIDAPDVGETPLFSRVYVRAMTPEQVYDSLLVATQADHRSDFDWDTAARRRHEWIQQFLFAHSNEENTESTTFDGSITQALSLMNSQLIQDAMSLQRGTLLADVVDQNSTPTAQIKAICRSVLSRDPSDQELAVFRRLLRKARTRDERIELLKDVLWAYLNSNEFILVH